MSLYRSTLLSLPENTAPTPVISKFGVLSLIFNFEDAAIRQVISEILAHKLKRIGSDKNDRGNLIQNYRSSFLHGTATYGRDRSLDARQFQLNAATVDRLTKDLDIVVKANGQKMSMLALVHRDILHITDPIQKKDALAAFELSVATLKKIKGIWSFTYDDEHGIKSIKLDGKPVKHDEDLWEFGKAMQKALTNRSAMDGLLSGYEIDRDEPTIDPTPTQNPVKMTSRKPTHKTAKSVSPTV